MAKLSYDKYDIYKFMQEPHNLRVGSSNNIITAKDIIIAIGSVPYVPKGIEVDSTQLYFLFYWEKWDVLFNLLVG